MRNILFTSCFITGLFIAYNNKPEDRKLRTTARAEIDTSKVNNKVSTQKPQITASTQTDTGLVWVDYRLGMLIPREFYAGMDTLVKKYKLRYKRIEAGCMVDGGKLIKAEYELQNERYFKEMEKIYGKDWKKRFDAELQVLDR